jgi:hypothetical protein
MSPKKRRGKDKPRKICQISVDEVSLVEKPAMESAVFAVIKAAAAETSGDGDGPTIERILEAYLGPDYPGADLSAFKQAVANIDEFENTIPENLKDSAKVLVWCILEAMAGGFKLKSADEEADQADGKGKNGGVKKGASFFPTLGGSDFLRNFVFGTRRLEKWLEAEELRKQADADDDAEPEPAVRRPTRKSLNADDVDDDEDAEAAAEADIARHMNVLGGFGIGFRNTPKRKTSVRKSLDVQDDDDTIKWPSLNLLGRG